MPKADNKLPTQTNPWSGSPKSKWMKSRVNNEGPDLVMPKTDMIKPMCERLRGNEVESMLRKSQAEIEKPKRDMPQTKIELPKHEKPRSNKEGPG